MIRDVLQSIQVGMPRSIAASNADGPHDKPWFSGFFKSPVHGPVEVTADGLDGDGQADLVHHGGVDKAILCYGAVHYQSWAMALNRDDVCGGMFGENFTFATLTEREVCVGDTFSIGDVVVQVSQPRQPCWKLNRRWGDSSMVKRTVATGFCGWYCRVLRPGFVSAGMEVLPIERPFPEWTVRRAHEVMFAKKSASNVAARRELSAIKPLSAAWRADL